MSTMGTFDAFTSARLGIYAAQHGFRVTGNNISNINTIGYTRQRLDQVSFKAGAYDRYRSELDNHVGSGALVMNINQVRDPTLDVRYRDVSASFGFNNEMLEGLDRIASILDEVGVGDDTNVNKEGDGRLHAQIQAVLEAMRNFSANPTKSNNDLVRNAASSLCEIINSYARELETLRVETEQKFNDKVKEINECLTNIRNLNEEIRDNEIFGDNALELRDERNRQIDKLSEYLHISVTYSYEDVGAGKKVEKLTIKLDDSNPDSSVHTDESVLIDGIFGAQLYSPKLMLNGDFDPSAEYDDAAADPADNIPTFQYLVSEDDLPEYLDPTTLVEYGEIDGKTFYCTNDPALASKMDNSNFDLQISKLVDQRGREWKDAQSLYTPITNQQIKDLIAAGAPINPGWTENNDATTAKYSFLLTPAAGATWKDGDQFEIAGTTYTIGAGGAGISANDANDPEKMAAFIAGKLTSTKFNISAEGAKIVYTAKTPGAIPTEDLPSITTVNDPEHKLRFGSRYVETAGKDNSFTPPNPTTDVDDKTGTETIVSYLQVDGVWNKVTTTVRHTYEVDLDDNDTYGSLQAIRELLTEKGEFVTADDVAIDEGAAKKRGIPFYQMSLDLFANKLAAEYNKLNNGFCYNENGNYVDADGKELELAEPDGTLLKVSKTNGLTEGQAQNLIANGYATTDSQGNTVPDLNKWLTENKAKQPEGVGNLFSNRNDGDKTDDPPINASNITISHSWAKDDVQLIPKYQVLWDGSLDQSSQNTNADHMVTMLDKDNILIFNPQDIDPDAISTKLFEGSFGEMFNDMNTTRGEDTKKVTVALNMYYTQQVEIDTARDSVSGVDLNDEAMNLMQYQKAYSAACRLMTVVDEALDRLINNTGIAGR